ncbi:molecular chaperone Tir [Haloferula helveola]|uniref:Molecular chaperone Tir n=1 Tax=Haloferula helveola TaxID=490095 RepID=A0ABM7R7N5_9BACT|nr:molecular chaperone Tir [Haloferula helveola]
MAYDWDLFVSHASEDKEPFVRALVLQLREFGLRVWHDEFALIPGDSLSESIDLGLNRCRFGLVVLSEHFFGKRWTRYELSQLAARERDGSNVLLPLWFGIDEDIVRSFSEPLADRCAFISDGSELLALAERIFQAVDPVKHEQHRCRATVDRCLERVLGPTVQVTDEGSFVHRSYREVLLDRLPDHDEVRRAPYFVMPAAGAEERALDDAWWEAFFDEMLRIQRRKWSLPLPLCFVISELPITLEANRLMDRDTFLNISQTRHGEAQRIVEIDFRDMMGCLRRRTILVETGDVADSEPSLDLLFEEVADRVLDLRGWISANDW